MKDALEEAQLLDVPSLRSVIAMRQITRAYLANNEHGKAIDLLNRAVSQSAGKLSGIVAHASKLYASREREDKAQEDLINAVDYNPKVTHSH